MQGEHPDSPMRENYIGKPASPYGYHKKIAEDLCQSYSEKFGLQVAIVRLFSVYGNGLKKQLLWDACNKIKTSNSEVTFWGTGDETRDFIHVEDVARLFDLLLSPQHKFIIVNGGSGTKHTIKEAVELIRINLSKDVKIDFNNQVNIGNPLYYWADMERMDDLNFSCETSFEDGLKKYVQGFEREVLND